MANTQINIKENGTTVLATSGCYCDRDIDVIVAVEGGGSAPAVIEALEIVENGTYTAPEGVDGYSPITVNVPTGGDGGIPEEAFVITGDCTQRFSYDGWNWFIEEFGNRTTSVDITSGNSMFFNSYGLKEVPFAINFKSDSSGFQSMFSGAQKLREVEINLPTPLTATRPLDNIFYYAYSLRKIKGNFFEQLKTGKGGYSYGHSTNFQGCYSLDEIVGLPFMYGSSASYSFYNTFKDCNRLKRLTFKPYTFTTSTTDYKGATIDLSANQYVGYSKSTNERYITGYNSGITADKKINSAETLAALYDDPDCYTLDINYSRYNHDSAAETIRSLPDVTAVASGGTSTIKFAGQSGAATPAGAIENLTEEEIAVATAKGWTVSLA